MRNIRIPQVFTLIRFYVDPIKVDKDFGFEHKKKCKPRKCLIYTFYWRRDRLSNLHIQEIS